MEESHILVGLLAITLFNIILGGDNAVVIAMATKQLPRKLARRASFWGTLFAIVIRIIFVIIFLIIGEREMPLFYLLGGIALIYIAWNLIGSGHKEEEVKEDGKEITSITSAVKTIVIADTIMSIDNALIIAAIAAKTASTFAGEVFVSALGVIISIPIILFGAMLLSGLMKKYPVIVYIGAFLVLKIGASLIVLLPSMERLLGDFVDIFPWILSFAILALKLGLDHYKKKKHS